MKIKAELKSNGDTLEVDIPSNSRKDALEQFFLRYPPASILEIEGRVFIGRCEGTSHPILEGDAYQEDADGVIWLTPG